MYRAGIEGILGIRREGPVLVVEPCIPDEWPGFTATVTVSGTRYDIRVESSGGRAREAARATLDGAPVPCMAGCTRVPLEGGAHTLVISL
jgi:cyclic beta-1,2-glucan synthetase